LINMARRRRRQSRRWKRGRDVINTYAHDSTETRDSIVIGSPPALIRTK
jgi:hypothetical protein